MAGIISDSAKLGGVPQKSSAHVALSTCYDIFKDSDQIGFISGITIGHARTVTQHRHLNSVDAGIAVDSSTTPDVVTLNYTGFYVYSDGGSTLSTSNVKTGTSGGRLSGIGLLMTLDQQQQPFDIVIRHNATGANNATDTSASGTVVGVYKNCTLASMSVPIQISTAAVSDSGSISVGYVAGSATGNLPSR